MIFLLLNIVFASLFALCIKWVENREKEDIVTVGMLNYIFAAIGSAYEFTQVPSESVTFNGFLTGGTMGFAYFVAFFFCVYAIMWIGVANSTVISILSICVPILAGVFVWSEDPDVWQWLGIGLALVALSLIGNKGDATKKGEVPDRPWFTPWVVVGFFILCALSRLAQEAFRHLCEPAERPVYLTAAFGLAAIPSVAVLLYRKKAITSNEWIMGFALGATNILQTHFILKSLSLFDGFIVFPVVSAGSLLFVTCVATIFLGEKLGKLTYAGIGITCIALVLLN